MRDFLGWVAFGWFLAVVDLVAVGSVLGFGGIVFRDCFGICDYWLGCGVCWFIWFSDGCDAYCFGWGGICLLGWLTEGCVIELLAYSFSLVGFDCGCG